MAPRAAHRLVAARVRAAHGTRNLRMAERLGAMPVSYPFSFVVAGDSGAWPDVTADAIFASLLEQAARLEPWPVLFANLGDFAGPGTAERHERYLRALDGPSVPGRMRGRQPRPRRSGCA